MPSPYRLLLMLALLLAGCASTPPEGVVSISPDRYDDAFDAALDVARDAGLTPALRDRRTGVIETDPDIVGSIAEPWSIDNASIEQALRNTINLQRRRARFTFTSENTMSADTDPTEREIILSTPLPDLTLARNSLILDVEVVVERAGRPGQRRHPWSRRLSTQATHVIPDTDGETWPRIVWTPVGRDEAAERRLLDAVRRRLEDG